VLKSCRTPLLLALTLLPSCPLAGSGPTFAICMAGHTRSLSSPVLQAATKQLLVDSLASVGGRADVFTVFQAPATAASHEVAAALGAVHVEFNTTLYHRTGDSCRPSFGTQETWLHSYLGQSTKVASCFRSVFAREAAAGVRYDFIIRSRPDLGYFAPVAGWLLPHLLPDSVFVGYIWGKRPNHRTFPSQDYFAAVPRQLAESYAQLDTLLNNCTLDQADVAGNACHMDSQPGACPPPECLLSYFLASHGIVYHACWTQFAPHQPLRDLLGQPNLFTLVRFRCHDSATNETRLSADPCRDGAVELGLVDYWNRGVLAPYTGAVNSSLPMSAEADGAVMCSFSNGTRP